MEKTKKNDFIEIEFIGRVKDGEIFDTNIKEQAKKINLNIDTKPFIICIGQSMVIPGFDKALEGKEINKKYKIEISPEQAFGKRNSSLVKLMPLKVFTEKNIQPRPGMTLALDNLLVKIITVSGGRVLADFNIPLAGKIIIYEFKIKRKIEDINEKVNTLMNFFLKQKFEFEIKQNEKTKEKELIIKAPKELGPLIELSKTKFKDILGMEVIIKEKKTEKKQEK